MATDKEKQDAQTREEEKLISNLTLCTVPSSPGLESLNAAAVKSALGEDFYNPALLEALTCYFSTTVHSAEGLGNAPAAIHEVLTNAHKIGEESVEGVAIATGINGVKDLVVIKAPQNPSADGLVHEYFVAAQCLNKLRKFVPGFMYAFSGFRCPAPKIVDGKLEEWCMPGNGALVNYVVFERIPGKSLGSEMAKCTMKEYLSYLVQVALNLERAVADFSYTHYDLHDGNVLNRTVQGAEVSNAPENDGWFYVPFVGAANRIVFVRSNRVPTIIDYGRNHVKYEGKHYGFFSTKLREEDGLYPDKARPLYDLYKLIGFSLYSAMNASPPNTELLAEAWRLMSFFRPITKREELEELMKTEREGFFTLSTKIGEKEQSTSIQDWLMWLRTTYTEYYDDLVHASVPPDSLVLTCGGIVKEDGRSIPSLEGEKACAGKTQLVKRFSFRTVPARTLSVRLKSPEDVLREAVHTERRQRDRSLVPRESVETEDIEVRMEANREYLSEHYEALRAALIARLSANLVIIKREAILYSGLNWEGTVRSTERANYQELLMLFQRLQDSRYLHIVSLIKKQLANAFVLARLEEMEDEENPTTLRQFAVPSAFYKQIQKDSKAVTVFLERIAPLSADGEGLKRSILNMVSVAR